MLIDVKRFGYVEIKTIFASQSNQIDMLTPFEQAQKAKAEGKLNTPVVNAGGKNIDYFGYQLAVHKFNLSIMSKGMKCRGITFTQIKKYYGLKGRSAADCLEQMNTLVENYKLELAA